MPTKVVRAKGLRRLHFGLLSFNQPGEREFGGIGVMINGGVRLVIRPSGSFETSGLLAERAQTFAERFCQAAAIPLPNCQIEVTDCPQEHTGLGVGTQLGMTLGMALEEFLGRDARGAAELSEMLGRGKRSAIGSHGAKLGGFLYERGKMPGEAVAKLHQRLEVPQRWRFVLLTLQDELTGLWGTREQMAFDKLPPVPKENSATLRRLANQMRKALRAGRCARVQELLWHYGYHAGMCFKKAQGGPFASGRVSELVYTVRKMGLRGVAQSSWGPTVAVLFNDESQATRFIAELSEKATWPNLDISLATPNNSGVEIKVE